MGWGVSVSGVLDRSYACPSEAFRGGGSYELWVMSYGLELGSEGEGGSRCGVLGS